MGYLDRFSIQGMDGDKLTGLVIFGVVVFGFIIVASIAGAFLPSAPGEKVADPKTGGTESTTVLAPTPLPQTIPQASAPTATVTPNVTARRNWDDYGSSSSSSSSSGGSSSHSTPTPAPTPVPLTRPQLLSNVKVNNTDANLVYTINNSLNNTIDAGLSNISGINVVNKPLVKSICGNDTALGCYFPINKTIYIGELQSFNSTSICNTFENTLYHEEGHAIYLSNHTYVNYSNKTYGERPDEIYADTYANGYSKDRCATPEYIALNNSKNSNYYIYKSAFEIYSYWAKLYPNIPSDIPSNRTTDYYNDYYRYNNSFNNYTIANNSLNNYMLSHILSTNPAPIDTSIPVCTQVITWGHNPITGETIEFPTSCLPNGWVRVIVIAPSPSPNATINVTPIPSISPNVTVLPLILTTISILPISQEINISKTLQFTAYPKDQYGASIYAIISWVSSNESVGTIDASGLFTTIKAGETTITARSNSVSVNTTIIVLPKTVIPGISIEKPLLSFLWITDAHCGVLNDCSDLNIAINKANDKNIRYMVDTGDLIEENSTIIDLKTLQANVTKCKLILDCFYIPGNHDLTYINEPQWITITGNHTTPYSVDVGEVRLIFLNETPISMEHRVGWLQDKLSTTTKAIIFNHYPLQGSSFLTNMLGITDKVIATFYGNDHKNENGDRFKVNYFIQESFAEGAYSVVNITNNSINITGYRTSSNGIKAGTYNLPIRSSNGLNSLEVSIPELQKIPPPPMLVFLQSYVLEIPNATPLIPILPPTDIQLPPTHTISSFGNIAISTDTNGFTESGSLNEVLSKVALSGNRILIRDGKYSLTPIHLPTNTYIECESNNAVLTTSSSDDYVVYLNSDSTIKGCTFDGHNKPIYIKDNVVNWRVEGNNFINAKIAVDVENLTSDPLPTSGYGVITNNKGIGSKLVTLMGTRNIIVSNNIFRNLNDNSEFADFNYNVHFVTFENNSFINDVGYSIDQEVIDMVGGNGFTNSDNIIRNNTIIGNFQSGIRPAKSATNNIIENNYIEFTPGRVIHEANIYVYGDTATFSTPKYNTIRNNVLKGGKYGIVLSGADNNNIYGNNISNSQYGIGLVKDTIYGANDAPKNNYVWNNIISNVDYGIYLSASPDNLLSNNIITASIKAIDGQNNNIPIPITVNPDTTPIPTPSDSCYIVPSGIPLSMQKYLGNTACISCGHHNPISSSWKTCNIPINTPTPTQSPTISPNPNPIPAGSATIAYLGDARPSKFGSKGITDLTADMNQIIPQSPTGKVDAIFMIGDMDHVEQTVTAYKASNVNTIPMYFVVGNHEVDNGDMSYLRGLPIPTTFTVNLAPKGTEKTAYSVDIGNTHVTNMNIYWDGKNNDASLSKGRGGGCIVPELYNWVQSDLSSTSNWKVVLGHEPMYPKQRHVGDSLDSDTKNRDDFENLLVNQGVSVFVAAHTHYGTVNLHDNIYHVDAGISGAKVVDGEDPYASITYTVSTPESLTLTWKHENPTWSNPKVTTYTINKPTTQSLNIEKSIPQLGVFNREKVPEVDNPLLKWQVIATPEALLSYNNPNSIVAFNYWEGWSDTKSKWTDIAPNGFIQQRFNDAYTYKDHYNYAPFLLHEEMYSPIALSTWAEPFSSWQLDGKATFNGIEVKLLKTWLWEDKGISWDSSILKDIENPLLVEWDKYYSTRLYQAWNEYIHGLGKKSMVIGLMSPRPIAGTYGEDLNYAMSANEYVLSNYDAIVEYSYPRNIDEVVFSKEKSQYVRGKYNGTLLWLLTTSFSNMPWDWTSEVANSEFNAVHDNVDGIITYPYSDMGHRKNPYPYYLLGYYGTLNGGV